MRWKNNEAPHWVEMNSIRAGCWVDDDTTINRYRKIVGSKNSMANFETVKMLAKKVSFLLENVFRIRFYLHGKLTTRTILA